jgi:hypothetical protein
MPQPRRITDISLAHMAHSSPGGFYDMSKRAVIGRAPRVPKHAPPLVPGPGEYECSASVSGFPGCCLWRSVRCSCTYIYLQVHTYAYMQVGVQAQSTKPSQPAFGFSKKKSYRSEGGEDPTFISKSHVQVCGSVCTCMYYCICFCVRRGT